MRRDASTDRRDANDDSDAYYPLRRLADYSGLCIRTLRSYLVHPSTPLPHYRIGGKILVRRSDYDAWAARFRVTARPVVDDLVNEVLADLQGC